MEFERGYSLYRLNQVPEALRVVESVQNPSLKIKELKAQILYRLERYEECLAVYKDIIKNSHDDYEEERETNLAAVLANLAMEKSVSLARYRKSSELVMFLKLKNMKFLGARGSLVTRPHLRIDV